MGQDTDETNRIFNQIIISNTWKDGLNYTSAQPIVKSSSTRVDRFQRLLRNGWMQLALATAAFGISAGATILVHAIS